MSTILQAGFADGSIIDGVLALLVVEGAVLLLMRHRFRLALSVLDVVAALGAGAALLLALRSALRGAPWPITASWLALAGVAHAIDVSRRVSQSRRAQRSF